MLHPQKIKLSVSLFFACYALSQLFWGAISEKYGRRPAILSGFMLSIVGTITVIASQGIFSYIIGRCLEGVGIGVVSPVGRAILADVFDRMDMARILATLSSITGLMPALAPIVGGFILAGLGWRFIFVFFLILLSGYIIWSYYYLPETHRHSCSNLTLFSRFKGYGTILKQSAFWGYIACYAITQGTLLGYYGAMPFWYVKQWNVPEQYYAFLALFSVGGYLFALMLTRHFVKRFSLEKILRIGLWSGFCVAIISFSFALFQMTGILPLVITMSLFAITPGIAFPAANASVMAIFKSQAAMASALSTTLVFLMAAIFSYIESHLNVHSMWELAALLIVVNVVSLLSNYLWMPR